LKIYCNKCKIQKIQMQNTKFALNMTKFGLGNFMGDFWSTYFVPFYAKRKSLCSKVKNLVLP
jgi:hypothetical protein